MTTRQIISYAENVMEILEWLLSRKLKIFKLFGISITLNSSVIAIPVILALIGNLNWGMIMCVLIGGVSILLHEVGHALCGYAVGNPAKEIFLLACGGLTTFTRNLGTTTKDAMIGIAGPMTNGIVFILVIWIEKMVWGGTFSEWCDFFFSTSWKMGFLMDEEYKWGFIVLNAIALINADLFAFNILPAFPLDGGRILRWFISCFMHQRKAALTTMVVSCILASLLYFPQLVADIIQEFNPSAAILDTIIFGWICAGSFFECWRTNLYCAAENGSVDARERIRWYFNEDILPVKKHQ